MSSTRSLAEQFGTPSYVYDLTVVETQLARLRAALPVGSKIIYSLKANPHPHIVKALIEQGAGADVSSIHELRTALDAGAQPRDIVVTGPAKSSELIRAAIETEDATLSIESAGQAEAISRLASQLAMTAKGLLRINVDVAIAGSGLAFAGRPSQFGIDLDQAVRIAPELVRLPRLHLVGSHFFLGTNVSSVDALLGGFAAAAGAAAELGVSGLDHAVVDLGGGFSAPYANDDAAPTYMDFRPQLEQILDDQMPGWRGIDLWFESGRYLVGPAGKLVCRVIDVKHSKGEKFVIVDSGIHHLGGMSGLGRLPPLRAAPSQGSAAATTDDVPTRLVGELCASVDSWNPRASLPDVEPGDLLEIANVGAYGLTASLLGFLSHDAPTEVVIGSDRSVSASRLRSERDYLSGGSSI